MQASALLLHWGTYHWARNMWVLIIYLFFLLVMLPSMVPGVWKLLSFLDSLPGTELHPYLFCLSSYFLYFFLPPFEDNGLLFWVPDVLCRHQNLFKCSYDEYVGEKVVSPIPPPFRAASASFKFMAAITICSDFGVQRNKVSHCFPFFPIYFP